MSVLKYVVNHQTKYTVLVELGGEKINNDVLNFIGVTVEIKGILSVIDGWGILKIDVKNNLHISDKY